MTLTGFNRREHESDAVLKFNWRSIIVCMDSSSGITTEVGKGREGIGVCMGLVSGSKQRIREHRLPPVLLGARVLYSTSNLH